MEKQQFTDINERLKKQFEGIVRKTLEGFELGDHRKYVDKVLGDMLVEEGLLELVHNNHMGQSVYKLTPRGEEYKSVR